ncbi:ExbD/TolR family protein [Allohahella marinimesophila]|uniref:Biopolymer transport protein ExbD n=1 Tax=Allohahella marinimesophila TaxID=1054972 RepID=A0ABP7PEN9_9GAMM
MMRRKHRRLQQEAELDITAFMNLMIVLVPVLLINMVFASNGVLDLNFPLGSSDNQASDEKLQLQVMIYPQQLIVSDDRGGVIASIAADQPSAEERQVSYDFDKLTQVMQQIKARLPDKRDIVIMARPQTDYQTLISVMDRVRAYPAMVAGSLVQAELFPDISIADAPEAAAGRAETPSAAEGGAQP